jgi:protein farnesyltransferase subunit beta
VSLLNVVRNMYPLTHILSGAYCAVVIITLLDLPLDLPKDSSAWSQGGDTLLTGLPEWVGRCKYFSSEIPSLR